MAKGPKVLIRINGTFKRKIATIVNKVCLYDITKATETDRINKKKVEMSKVREIN